MVDAQRNNCMYTLICEEQPIYLGICCDCSDSSERTSDKDWNALGCRNGKSDNERWFHARIVCRQNRDPVYHFWRCRRYCANYLFSSTFTLIEARINDIFIQHLVVNAIVYRFNTYTKKHVKELFETTSAYNLLASCAICMQFRSLLDSLSLSLSQTKERYRNISICMFIQCLFTILINYFKWEHALVRFTSNRMI